MNKMIKNTSREKCIRSNKDTDCLEKTAEVQNLLNYFSKIDNDTREFYIKTILRIYYLLNETK